MSPEERDLLITKHRELLAWKDHPCTKELFALLTERYASNCMTIIHGIPLPGSEGMPEENAHGFQIRREQLIGEARGFDQPRVWLENTLEELGSLLKQADKE